MKEIKKFVITGGPCGGKSDALTAIRNHFEELGWKVLITPETPTELIYGGVAPWTCGSYFQYQICQMDLHQKTEDVFLRAAKGMPEDRIMIICDRGQFDCMAYMTEEEFDYALDILNISKESLLKSYDAVFHLQSVGVNHPDVYEKEKITNPTRIEDAASASELDEKTKIAWQSHPNHYIVDSTADFKDKIINLLDLMDKFLFIDNRKF